MKKKIYIVIIVCVLLFIVGIGIVIKLNMGKEVISQTAENLQEESLVDIIENKVEEEIIQSETKTEEIEEEQVSETISEEIIFNNDTQKEETKEQEPIKKEQEVVVEEPLVTTPIPKEEVKENVVVQEQVQEEVKEEVKPEEVIKPVEEYRINQDMINKMIKVINDNPSDWMIKNGYTVVQDASITSLTNQFTFTEIRVINKILYKFNTIKVYAHDYYNNGEYIMTQCYIF